MRLAYKSQAKPALSHHAKARMQQRSIPNALVELLLDWGEPVDAGSGCYRYEFRKSSLAEARRLLGRGAKSLDRYLNAYVVVTADDLVVTAARCH